MNYMSSAHPGDEPEVWRLYHGTRAVGFGKQFGSGMMWSRTGASYSGTTIPHAIQVRALPLRTFSGSPIFHGDVVSPPGEEAERYLVLGVGDEMLFATAGSARFIRREHSAFAQRRDFVRHGNVLESPQFSRTFDAALRAYASREFPSTSLSWSLAVLVLAGGVVPGVLEWLLRGGVGLILSCLGAIAVGWGFFFAWKWRSPETFRRSSTSRVAYGAVWRTGALSSGAWGAAVALGLTGVTPSLGAMFAGMLAAAVLGLCLAMVAGVLAADSLTRHQDRQLGLASEMRSFIETPSSFLRVLHDGDDAFPQEPDNQH